MILIQLRYDDGSEAGVVHVIKYEDIDPIDEVSESWHEFYVLEEFDDPTMDNTSVDDFVSWHNEERVTQIERVFVNETTRYDA